MKTCANLWEGVILGVEELKLARMVKGLRICLHCAMKGYVIGEYTIKMRGDRVRATSAAYEPTIDSTQFATDIVMTEPRSFFVANIKVSLILDSRATEHIVPDRAAFEAYKSGIPLSSS